MNTQQILQKAQNSPFYLWLLNVGLSRMIPFNGPHGFKISRIQNQSIETTLPYKRKNLNHIKGLHACALATLSEFTTGVLLISKLDPSKYRIILKKLEMEYLYQGKMNAYAKFELSEEYLQESIIKPLQHQDAIDIVLEVKTYDQQHNHLCTGHVNWQIKSWEKVKMKV